MPKKGKSNKKNQSRKNKSHKSNKSPKKSPHKSSKQSHNIRSHDHKESIKRHGQAYSKQLIPILSQLTSVLREVDHLKGNPLYETAIKLDDLCDKIIKLQCGANESIKKPKIWGFEDVQNTDQQIILNRLTLWIKKEQTDSFIGDKFEFKANLREGRGVIATKDLKEGEHAMSIHRKLMITYDFALNKSDDKIQRFLKKDPLCKKVASLALVLFVWYERMKRKRSFWKPYMDALPLSFGLPHECKIRDLIPFLSGSLILDKIIRLKISHLRHYTYARQMLNRAGIEPGMRLIDYLWAAGVVMTRQNRIPTEINNDCESEIALIPAWDMCNYKSGKITTYFNTKQARNEMFIMNDVAKGEQIYIYYGSQRNELLYLNSGFVFADNINDELEIVLRLDMNDILYKVKGLQVKNAKLSNPIKCLLPVLNHKKYENKNIKLDAKIDENEMKEIEQKRKEKCEIIAKEKHYTQYEDRDISTKWILSVFESLGLSIPPPCIKFARISAMTKTEIMKFMQRMVVNKKEKIKQKQDKIISEQVVDLENIMDKKEENNKTDNNETTMVKKADEIGEPKELISFENEIKAWNAILDKAQIMFDFFTEKLNLCKTVHIDGNDGNVNEEDELYGNERNNKQEEKLDSIKVLKELRETKKDHVALSFELLDIERNHYGQVVKALKHGISIVEERLKRVCKLETDDSRVVSV